MNRLLHPALCAAAVLAAAVGCATVPTGTQIAPDRVVLAAVPGGIAASSARHGPFSEFDGRAMEFSHDGRGAAIAATHIRPRITPAAGADVMAATLAQQCWGNVASTREPLVTALPRPNPAASADATPTTLFFRVIAGDAHGEHIVVSLLADTPQSRAMGGYSRIDVTLRRHNDDWQLRVPVRRPSLHPDATGYELLGPTS